MDVFSAFILGLIQGLTEFLPVSSSGHLAIGSYLFGLENGEENLSFTIIVHAATVLSTIVVLHNEIWNLLKGVFKFKWNEEMQYACKILLSMVPILIVGLFFKDVVEEFFGNGLLLVGICLLITATLLFFAYKAKPRQKEHISFLDSFIIGLSQAVAVLPGLSRSGTTIATGLLLGNKKETVSRFSFLMVIIPILGEAFLDSLDMMQIGTHIDNILPLIVGFVTAFLSGCFACKWMLKIVQKGKLIYFAIYCIIAAATAITLNFIL